jgi:hypothetical protein
VQQYGRDVHDDERDGSVLGDREPGWERQLRGGGAGDADSERDPRSADDHIYDERSGERGLRGQLHGGGYGQFGPGGCVHQFRVVQQLGRYVHDDEWDGDVLGNREPVWQRQLRSGGFGDADGECDAGSADDYVYDERSGERGIRRQLHSGCCSQLGTGGLLHEFGRVQQLGRDVHDDERDGNVLGHRNPGWQRQLRSGRFGDADSERNTGSADDRLYNECSGERGLQQQLYGGGQGQFGVGGGLRQRWIMQQFERYVHDDERDGNVFSHCEPAWK